MATTTDLAELTYLAWLSEEEKVRQRVILTARDYYNGEQHTELSARQKEFLGFKDSGRFCINYCRSVIDAVAERMIVAGFESEDEALSSWAWDVWQNNRMDAHQMDVHLSAVRDGEYFVFVHYDTEQKRVRFIPHPRYTDPQVNGDGFGCKIFFDQDDPTNPALYASKRWTETIKDERGKRSTRQRMNLYYPERIEKYVMAVQGSEASWTEFQEEGQAWPLPWVGKNNEPLGIPIIPFFNPNRVTELWDAIPIQDAINKTAIDLIASVDAAGFPIRLTNGFYFTTDGKEPTGDNYVSLTPGAFVYVPEGKSVTDLEVADLGPLLETLDNWIIKLGQVTDTPLSRFQLTKQVRSEKTLRQEEAPLISRVRERQTRFGNSWEDCFQVATRLENAFGSEKPDIESLLSTLWEPAETRDEERRDRNHCTES